MEPGTRIASGSGLGGARGKATGERTAQLARYDSAL
jgi:hypothetical protein